MRLDDARRTLSASVRNAAVDVGHLEREVDDAVAMPPMVVEQRAVRRDAARDDEASRAAPEHERLVVTVPGFGSGVGDEFHAEGRLIEVRRLGCVAHHEHHRIHGGHGEWIAALVVLHQSDELLELLEVEVRRTLVRRQGRVTVELAWSPLASRAAESALRTLWMTVHAQGPLGKAARHRWSRCTF